MQILRKDGGQSPPYKKEKMVRRDAPYEIQSTTKYKVQHGGMNYE
jgi:hypothetical protein